ncbi:hypothetical protein [Methanosalsum natronophilum]|uniref:hypothetical protein n=1 Tax=Methanosalsum natronophilum TaxID=768733 RepID=UPI00216A5A0A|nr:hypothetical protein [Methanosalsum natronophilum]MCS3923989.1 hypothetical protein [Methanosalsum natronophilum]
MEKIKKNDLTTSNQPLSSIEMGRDDVNLICTYGKISIWFGRKVPDLVIGKILIAISNVDPATIHEYELVCDFEKITEYESFGFILVSYAKVEGGYRATFHIPFTSKKALLHLTELICNELRVKNLNLDLYWTGDDSDIIRLFDVLRKIDKWKIKSISYKEESQLQSFEKDID